MVRKLLLTIAMICIGLANVAQVQPTPVANSNNASRQKQTAYNVLFLEAITELQNKHYDDAFHLLDRCREMLPEASEAYYYLGNLYLAMANQNHSDSVFTGKARSMLTKAAKLEPQNMTYMEQLGDLYIRMGNNAEAIAVTERMYQADKSRTELLRLLYQLYSSESQYDKAVEVVDRMELIDGPSEQSTLAKCKLYIDMDDADNAVAEVRKLTKRYPNDLNYRTLLANTLLVTNQGQEAYDVLTQVLTEAPNNLRALQALRSYYVRQGDEAAADSVNMAILLSPETSVEDKADQLRRIIIESLQQDTDSTQVLELFDKILNQPNPSADLAELKATYMQIKEMPQDSVNRAYEYVLQLAPDHASARLHLVQQAWYQQDDSLIIELCRQARQYNPEEMAFYYYQGMAYYRKEDTDHALEAFQNGIGVITEKSNPEIVSDFYAIMGDLLHQKNQEAAAFAAYDSCLQWKPDNIGCLNNYAYFLSLKGTRLDEAETMSYKTVKAEPRNATYLDTYAWILFMQQRYAEARVYIDQALQNDSVPDAVILEHAGDIYALCGNADQAVAYWQQAQLSDPENKLLRRKIKRKKYFRK